VAISTHGVTRIATPPNDPSFAAQGALRNSGQAPKGVNAGIQHFASGRADLAVFRPSEGLVYVRSTAPSGQVAMVHWGWVGDRPFAGDFLGQAASRWASERRQDGAGGPRAPPTPREVPLGRELGGEPFAQVGRGLRQLRPHRLGCLRVTLGGQRIAELLHRLGR
jgi:hypothetical protein